MFLFLPLVLLKRCIVALHSTVNIGHLASASIFLLLFLNMRYISDFFFKVSFDTDKDLSYFGALFRVLFLCMRFLVVGCDMICEK
jgi:hypothetical protein